jgi:outer membrane lipase/esterase
MARDKINAPRICGVIIAGFLTASATFSLRSAKAQTAFTNTVAFGDSYTDTGNAIKPLLDLYRSDPVKFAYLAYYVGLYSTGRFSGGTNYVDTVSTLLGIPQANQLNFAYGGAKTDNTNAQPGQPGFAQQWGLFAGPGGLRIGPTDLVLLNVTANDALQYASPPGGFFPSGIGGTMAGVPAAAGYAATQTLIGINALVAAGTRNIVFTALDTGTFPLATADPAHAPIASAFNRTANSIIQSGLSTVAATGVRVEYLDASLVLNKIRSNPAIYGFASAGACTMACYGNSAEQSKYLFYIDSTHLTSHGFAVIGEYIINRLNAPMTFGPQAETGAIAEMAFAQSLFGRLDMFGGTAPSGGFQQAMAYYPPHLTKAPPAQPPVGSSLSVYISVDGGGGEQQSTTTASGYKFASFGGSVGAEYKLSTNAIVGAAFNYSKPTITLGDGRTKTDIDSYQFGLYGGWTSANFFAQGISIVGFQNYHNIRPGVFDPISSSPDGTTLAVGGKVGQLFNFAEVRAGPIAGLIYGRTRVDNYTESGDAALTLNVGKQTKEALVVSAGAQFRFPVTLPAFKLEPFINLTAESDLKGDSRLIQYGATSAPIIVNTLTIHDGNSQNVYGRIAGGVSGAIDSRMSVQIFANSTLGRRGGDNYGGQGALKIAF